MSEGMQFVLSGIGSMILGVVILAQNKKWSRRIGEQMTPSRMSERFQFNYSSEYLQGLYFLGGILLVLAGLLFFVKGMGPEPGSILSRIEGYLAWILIVTGFGGGLLFILYSNRRFRIKSK